MSLVEQKAVLRKAAFARRKAAHDAGGAGRSGLLSEFLAGHRGVPIAGYMPIRTEIDPRPAMAEASAYGVVGVPVITGEGQPLVFHDWDPEAAMVDGPFGAFVPASAVAMVPEIVVVPLVAWDLDGNRLGYGGGFYDRTLEGLRARRAALAIGFAYEAQLAQGLVVEPTDQRLDMMITENRVITFS